MTEDEHTPPDASLPLTAARDSGLIRPGEPLLVMLSGGADSVCLLDVALELGADVSALHVNYGLREGSGADEQHCRELCGQRGVALTVHTESPEGQGNLQQRARELRYRLAEETTRGDYAAAHTASDQAETVLYRLASSPGRRALLGMPARRGRLVRPLLGATRAEVRAYCSKRGLLWREDPSNSDPRFARARVRDGLLTALKQIAPATERTVAETALLLRDEAAVLDAAVDEALGRLGGVGPVQLSALHELDPALARLILRRLAEWAAGGMASLSRAHADAVLTLGEGGGSRSLDLGQGLRAIVEYGTLRFSTGEHIPEPDAVQLLIPGSVDFGSWTVRAATGADGEVTLSGDAIGDTLTVRNWRSGDRIRPVGLGGSKSLQDLFTDRKIPRALRSRLPVVEAQGEIVWVAGVAQSERFAANPADADAVALTARPAAGPARPPGS